MDLGSDRLASQLIRCLRLLRRHFSLPIREASFMDILEEARTSDSRFESLVAAAGRAGIGLYRSRLTGKAQVEEKPPFILFFRDGSLNLVMGRSSDGTLDRVGFDEHGSAVPCEGPVDPGRIWFTVVARPLRSEAVRGAEHQRERGLPADQAHWFWSIARNFRGAMLEVGLASLSLNLLRLAFPLGTMIVFDRVIPNNAITTLWTLVIGLSIAILFELLFGLVRQTLINRVSAEADMEVETALFTQVLDRRMEALSGSAGGVASRIRDYDAVREFSVSESLVSVVDMVFAVVFVTALFLFVGPLAWVPVAAIPVLVVIAAAIQPAMARAAQGQQQRSAEKNGLLVETIANMETVKANGAEAWRLQGWRAVVGQSLGAASASRGLTTLASALVSAVQRVVPVLTIVIGVHLAHSGQLSQGALFAAMMLSGLTVAPFARFGHTLMRWHKAKEAYLALDAFMREPAESDVRRQDEILRRPTNGAVTFDKVTFQYPGTNQEALSQVSFSIQPGEKIAIIGRSGSGKTSIGRLLLGLYRPNSGSVLLDGVDIRQIDPLAMRRRIGSLMQNVGLFRGSIRDNIALGDPSADDAAILKAAELAGVDEFVRLKEEGYAFEVGENGQFLAGGQRQSVGLARALLGMPSLLLLDEPTSAMDMEAEGAFTKRLRDYLTPTRTLVLMTHRTSLLALVDRIIVLDQGRIRMDGPRDQVLKAMGQGGQNPPLRVVGGPVANQPAAAPM